MDEKKLLRIKLGLNIFALIIFMGIFLFLLFYVYEQTLPAKSSITEISGYAIDNPSLDANLQNLSSYQEQFLPNLRFPTNNISYFIEESCSQDRIEKVLSALRIISEDTGNIYFHDTFERNESELIVRCPSQLYTLEDMFIAGEGGPTKYINSTIYPVIISSEIILYNETDKACSLPITELHELLHVFGFDHVNNSKDIMYPYMDCDKTLSSETLDLLRTLYSIEGLPDLVVSEAEARIFGNYINISISIQNLGLSSAKNSTLLIYADDKELDYAALGKIDLGAGRIFSLKNAKLPSKKIERITILVDYKGSELNKENNKLELKMN